MMKTTIYKNTIRLCIVLFCLAQLSGCIYNQSPQAAEASGRSFDASKVPGAIPKVEPLSKHGNKSYTMRGHKYKVLKDANGYHKRGYASWYGKDFHGKLTSNFERYNLYGMTAASTDLPLPTYVKVTNLKNGKEVILKVNDRGPFRHHRILDVSYAAAEKLGFADDGVAYVDIEAIDPNAWQNKMRLSLANLFSSADAG
jgi:rare lipoprotein A